MRGRILIALLVSGAAMLATATVAAAGTLSVGFGNSTFPFRALIASAPATDSISAGTVHVTENGTAVPGVSVTPVSVAQAGDFGVILLIDTSDSMRGQPLDRAMAAARTLAAQRTGNQELGVIGFNSVASTIVPVTTDASRISASLRQPPTTAFGTHIYDTTLSAIRELHASNITVGTVIVLSDGADVGSVSTEQDVAAAAAADDIHVYTVGVKDHNFSGATLSGLAHATGGTYTASDAAGLRSVFLRIESALTSRYVIRYRSRQAFGRHVQVRLWASGVPGTWAGTYNSPPAAVPLKPNQPYSPVASHSFWASTLALIVVSLLAAIVLVGGLLVHFVPRSRQAGLRERIGRFTSGVESEDTSKQASRPLVWERVEEWLSGLRWWPRFKEEVDVAAIDRAPAEIVALSLIATLTLAFGLALLVRTPVISMPLLLVAPFVVWSVIRGRADRQRRQFAEQLPGHLEQIGSAMRAGHSVVVAIGSMAKDASEPTHREFERALADERLGVPLDAALRPIARRMACSDIEQLSLVATLNQRTGGNMAEVLDLIADGARERAELRRELRTLTAQARMSRWIVTLLPPSLISLLLIIRPSYLHPLFHTAGGIIAMLLATTLLIVGSIVMRLLVPAEV